MRRGWKVPMPVQRSIYYSHHSHRQSNRMLCHKSSMFRSFGMKISSARSFQANEKSYCCSFLSFAEQFDRVLVAYTLKNWHIPTIHCFVCLCVYDRIRTQSITFKLTASTNTVRGFIRLQMSLFQRSGVFRAAVAVVVVVVIELSLPMPDYPFMSWTCRYFSNCMEHRTYMPSERAQKEKIKQSKSNFEQLKLFAVCVCAR